MKIDAKSIIIGLLLGILLIFVFALIPPSQRKVIVGEVKLDLKQWYYTMAIDGDNCYVMEYESQTGKTFLHCIPKQNFQPIAKLERQNNESRN